MPFTGFTPDSLAFLSDLAEHYDYVVVDLPAVRPCDHAFVLSIGTEG